MSETTLVRACLSYLTAKGCREFRYANFSIWKWVLVP